MLEVGEQDDPGELSADPHQVCDDRSWCLDWLGGQRGVQGRSDSGRLPLWVWASGQEEIMQQTSGGEILPG